MNSMRDIINLVEAHLPLAKGSANWAVDRKGAFYCVMRPIDFLKLTTGSEANLDKIMSDDFSSIDDYRDQSSRYNFTQYHMPTLIVSYPSGEVTGHEGRHRAAMILKAGGKSFPCVIVFDIPATWFVTYSMYDPTTEDEQPGRLGPFEDPEQADAAAEHLRDLEVPDNAPWATSVRVRTKDGFRMRKGPNGPWSNPDMPDHFVGQFDPSIVVPTSTMRFGPVKR